MTFNTPPSMTFTPCFALTSLATILCLSASATFSKFTREAFPFAALHIGALAYTSVGLILPTCVSHDDSSPILNGGGMLSVSELLNHAKHIFFIFRMQSLSEVRVF
jgi:hypothetical protein